jgi:hypothetical protein
MNSPLEQIRDLEEVIRNLHKVNSKLLNGQFIFAHREIGSLIAFFENSRDKIIKEDKLKNSGEGND